MTSSERARQALELFDAWVDLPAARRKAQLRELAARDPALHAEVEALLEADAADLIALPPDIAAYPAAAGSVAFPETFAEPDMASPPQEGAVQ